jgi:predicted dehydrogenase
MAEELKVGIVGLHRGHAFVEALNWSEHTTIVAICDVDADRLNASKEAFGDPTTFTDYGAMLDRVDLDMVVVASPIQTHVPMSAEALKRD